MKKILLILSLFLFSFGNINAQSGFQQNRYYQQQYSITDFSVDNSNIDDKYDIDKYGKRYYYKWWKKAEWYSVTGRYTYYIWQYNHACNCNQWGSYTQQGTYYYYNWKIYKKYYYYYNGRMYWN